MIDTGLVINVENRTIENLNDTDQIVVLGDNNSQLLTFSMDDKFDGIDILTKNIFIKYIQNITVLFLHKLKNS